MEKGFSSLSSCEQLLLIVDTSVLMNIGSGRPSLENLCDATETIPLLIIPCRVHEELKRFASSTKPSLKTKATTALKVLERSRLCKVLILSECISEQADDEVFIIAKELAVKKCRVVVATSDKALRRRCNLAGIPTVFLRRSQLRFETDYPL